MGSGPLTAVEFNAPRLYAAAGQYPVVADFNGDGYLDVASAAQMATTPTRSRFRWAMAAEGSRSRYSIAWGYIPTPLAVGDFNGDGKPDLAVGNVDSMSVSILLGNGDGTFQPQIVFSTSPFEPLILSAQDFNGDGKTDLAVGLGPDRFGIYLSNGDGTFQPKAVYSFVETLGLAAGRRQPNRMAPNRIAKQTKAPRHAPTTEG